MAAMASSKRHKVKASPPFSSPQHRQSLSPLNLNPFMETHLHLISNPNPDPNEQQAEAQVASEEPLLPGLPDDLAMLCLSHLPAALLFSVCRRWRRLLYSPSFPAPPFLSLYSLLLSSHDTTAAAPAINYHNPTLSFSSYDPLSATWHSLPPPPLPSPLLLRHPSFLSRLLPVQSLSCYPNLLLLSGTSPSLTTALPCPLVFNPSPPHWQVGPAFPISPRRWCAAGSLSGSVFLFSGVGSLPYDPSLARSASCWRVGPPQDNTCRNWKWDPLTPLRDATFSREAVEAVGSNGKLCMVNLSGRCAKEGAVYDVRTDRWEEMPPGLLSGWTGPAAADEGGNIYAVDEASGELRAYQWRGDTWHTVVEGTDRLRRAVHIAAGGGRVCAVVAGGEAIVVVDVKGGPPHGRGERRRMWVVRPPRGKRVHAVHVLPRMSRPES